VIEKRVLRPDRLREVPPSFSWIDHRLLRDGHLDHLQPPQMLLYFFLVLVGDASGLSYYSLRSLARYLKLSPEEIQRARASLLSRGLIAFEPPLYQVLSLPERPKGNLSPHGPSPRGGEPVSIGQVIPALFPENHHGH
jgi:hypothetical protein